MATTSERAIALAVYRLRAEDARDAVANAYAEAPTVLYDVVREGDVDGPYDEVPRTVVSEGPDDDAPSALDDTSWGTAMYASRRVAPVTAADIPSWGTVAPEAPRPARPYRERHEGASDATLVGVAVGITGAVFAALGVGFLVLAWAFANVP